MDWFSMSPDSQTTEPLLTRYRARNAFLTRYHAPGGLSPSTLATSAEVQVGRSVVRSPATARTVSHTWGSNPAESDIANIGCTSVRTAA